MAFGPAIHPWRRGFAGLGTRAEDFESPCIFGADPVSL
jgi:hypothetical protein